MQSKLPAVQVALITVEKLNYKMANKEHKTILIIC